MEDLLALFDAAIPDTIEQPVVLKSDGVVTSIPNIPQTKRRIIPQPTPVLHHRSNESTDSNDRFGIRMINRKISSLDLMNRMIDYPFHGTAQLCAASLSMLNTLLVEPTTILDVATVNGKTHLWTLGIVFTNSGSRIGPSGKAYCMLTIGTLTTGPTITIMSFGTSYLTFCRTARPGMVIALMNPRLLSPRTVGNNNDRSTTTTMRTFSITENEQLLIIGDAQDYGRCKATTSSKNEFGQWIPNSKACNNYVDKRQGDFCTHHRKHQQKTSNVLSANTMSTGKISSIQQLRTQAAAVPSQSMSVRSMQRTGQTNGATGNQTNRLLCKPTNSITALLTQPSLTKITITNNGRNQKEQQKLPLQSLQNRYTPQQSNNPLLSDKHASQRINNSTTVGTIKMIRTTSSDKSFNPYASKKHALQAVHSKAQQKADPQQVIRNALRTFDVLQHPPNRNVISGVTSTKENKKRRLLNTDTSGFNGSVPIPVPAKIFAQRNGGPNHASTFDQTKRTMHNSSTLRQTENVIVQQQMIASQLIACKTMMLSNQRSNATPAQSHVLQGKAKSMKETLKDDLFGAQFDSKERENIINAKSQFTSEVEAEEYARSRRVVCELEEQEFKVMSKANTNNQDGTISTPVIQKEWYCVVCKKHFNSEPIRCLRLHHRIQVERNIRTAKSKGEERLAMTEAKAGDGGLVLGTGLDWSRFPSNRYS